MVNKVILTGNVGKAPDVRRMTSGDPVVSFSLATSERWKDKAGEKKEVTTWHNIVIFDKTLAEVAEKYVKKGSKVYVSGPYLSREYTDRDGTKRRVYEVVLNTFRGELVLLDRAEGGGTRSLDDYGSGSKTPEERAQAERKSIAKDNGSGVPFDDDIPF